MRNHRKTFFKRKDVIQLKNRKIIKDKEKPFKSVAEASWEAYFTWKKHFYFHYRILTFNIFYLRLYTVDI